MPTNSQTFPKSNIYIKCEEIKPGVFTAATFDGKDSLDERFAVENANCKGVRQLWEKVKDAYPGLIIHVLGPCAECLPGNDPQLVTDTREPGSGWSLFNLEGDRICDLPTVGRHLLQGGEELYGFDVPDDFVPEIDQKYIMRHSNGDKIKIQIIDIMHQEVRAGKVA